MLRIILGPQMIKPNQAKNWTYRTIQTPLDYLIFCQLSSLPNFCFLGYVLVIFPPKIVMAENIQIKPKTKQMKPSKPPWIILLCELRLYANFSFIVYVWAVFPWWKMMKKKMKESAVLELTLFQLISSWVEFELGLD